ncbi:hypothetical protein GDO86_010518 [Hymenochirus boettgeri]|uniref:Tudor domain-containing protein n=1 Tax=Hymenochirus boettgeri TaxID=247094 RepID=A0A8T2JQT8_9PIPI|nr:hypothetical protein GDO86_010518 [Hymenochirus boettgeri]
MRPLLSLPVAGTSLGLKVCFLEVTAEFPFVRLWGSVRDREREYEVLRTEVQAYAAGSAHLEGWIPAVGQCCLVEIDRQWHRCELLHSQSSQYLVFLIDLGYSVLVRSSQLREACKPLFCLPPEVLGYILCNLVSEEQRSWSGQALDYLSSVKGQELDGVVRDLVLPHGLVLLEVLTVSKRLLELGLAKSLTDSSFRFLINSCLIGHLPATKAIPTITATKPYPDNMARQDPKQVWALEYFYPQLQVGVVEPVLITEVLNPQRMFCQLRSLSHEVQRMSENMHHFYEQSGSGESICLQPLIPGHPCACRGSDGFWYRSLLQDYFPDKKLAMVSYVDWGRRDLVSVNNLRSLVPDFLRMPVVTFPCSLYGISDGGAGWDPAVVSELRSMFQGKKLSARIDFYNSYEHVYAITLFGDDRLNLNYVFSTKTHNLNINKVNNSLNGASGANKEVCKSLKDDSEKRQQSLYIPIFPISELQIGKFYDALVEFVLDPSNFWIRTGENATKYSEMIKQMSTLYSQTSKLEGIVTKPQKGELCCTKFKDNQYYRAEVIAVKGKLVEVLFIDHGNTEIVDWYNVKKLPSEFKEMPGLAIHSCVADISPLEDNWSPEAILAFKMSVVDKRLVVCVVSKQINKYVIEVLDESRIQQRSVGKILSAAGHAKYEEIESVTKILDVTKPKDAKIESNNQCVPVHLNEDKSKSKTNYACSALDNDNIQYSPFEDQFFEPGTTIEVVVSFIISPGLFWCQNAAHLLELKALMQEMHNYCSQTDCQYKSGVSACLAKSSCDGRWYRAFITSDIPTIKSNSEHVDVIYIDYGITETVPVKDLRSIKNEFFDLKAQAFKCTLYNLISPVGENPFDWNSQRQLQFFIDLNDNIVNVFTPFTNICKLLVESGFATQLFHRTLAPSFQLQTYYYSMHDLKIGSEEEIFITMLPVSMEIRTVSFLGILKLLKRFQVLLHFTDHQWYRGFINSDKNGTTVFFVDFGNTEKIKKEDVLPIPRDAYELLLFPMQAIKCSLSDVPRTVPKEVVSWFENLVFDKSLRALIVAKEGDGRLIVDLFDGNQKLNSNVKTKLDVKSQRISANSQREACFSSLGNEKKTQIYGCGKIRSKEPKFQPYSHDNNSSQNIATRNHNTGTFRSREMFNDCKPNSNHESQVSQLNKYQNGFGPQKKVFNTQWREQSSELHQNVKTAYRCDQNSAMPPLQQNGVGSQKRVPHWSKDRDPSFENKSIISKSQQAVCLLKESKPSQPLPKLNDLPKQKFAQDTQLDNISEILNNENNLLEVLDENLVNLGDLVCAFFEDDGQYYRAVLKEKSSNGFHVQYIDYGNTSVIPACKIHRLPESLLSIPAMSICCALNKIHTCDQKSEDLLLKFSERTRDSHFECELLQMLVVECHFM